jgi:hypothetical protein
MIDEGKPETTRRKDKISDIEISGIKCLLEIREIIGDPTGKMMQYELVEHIRELNRRLTVAEGILGQLASGYWQSQIDQVDDEMSARILKYWKETTESNPTT